MFTKVECAFSMVVVPILPHAEFGPKDHGDDTPHFITCTRRPTQDADVRKIRRP